MEGGEGGRGVCGPPLDGSQVNIFYLQRTVRTLGTYPARGTKSEASHTPCIPPLTGGRAPSSPVPAAQSQNRAERQGVRINMSTRRRNRYRVKYL